MEKSLRYGKSGQVFHTECVALRCIAVLRVTAQHRAAAHGI